MSTKGYDRLPDVKLAKPITTLARLIMKFIGILFLVTGLLLGGRALTMDVGVEVTTPDFAGMRGSLRVANVDLMTQRQNYLIFAGILSVVGAILIGFGSVRPVSPLEGTRTTEAQNSEAAIMRLAPAVFDCPYCKAKGQGGRERCSICGSKFDVKSFT
jgi:hypothetical protein